MNLYCFHILYILFTSTLEQVDKKDQTEFYKSFGGSGYNIDSGWIKINGIPPHAQPDDINKIFYQLIYMENRNYDTIQATDPFVIWLGGGPGCASITAIYTEIGPYEITYDKTSKSYQVSDMEFSWNKIANILVIDQPFGTGLSWSNSSKFITETDQAAQYFLEVLEQFYLSYEKFKPNPFYLFGESYAGHYIPSFTSEILKNDKFSFLNYQGIGIAGAWINPLLQVNTQTQFHKQVTYSGEYIFSFGLVDKNGKEYVDYLNHHAQGKILNNNFVEGSELLDLAVEDNYTKKILQISPYNVWQYVDPNIPEVPDDYENFLNEHKKDFGIPSFINFMEANQSIYETFKADIAKSREKDLEYLLEKGKVLLYNGQLDYMVTNSGNLEQINNLNWAHIQTWKKQSKQFFKSTTGKVLGTLKYYENFFYLTVYQSGHMVAADQPEAAYIIFDSFINNKWK